MTLARKGIDYSPYDHFTIEQWAHLRADEPMTLNAKDVERLRALNDPISLDDAQNAYLPLARLLSLYVEAVQGLHKAAAQFLDKDKAQRTPFIIGVSGSVAVGKSTTARILHALMQRWPNSPKVDLVTTDGFLFPNAELEKRGLMTKKGFPESYNRSRFVRFLSEVKSGRKKIAVPLYSHLIYDVVPGEETIIDQPDILIVEGLNILQGGDLPADGSPSAFASDYLDFAIYMDADEAHLRQWFVERFFRLRDTAFTDPESFFHQFSKLSETEARDMAIDVWKNINLPNLTQNILPTRARADLILTKRQDHTIGEVALRKI
ncbi:MAG: type I pantothenate kinase [Devosiaceae bacterium]|nr:type I pantothenate kinase [Devosiaceae bacterium]